MNDPRELTHKELATAANALVKQLSATGGGDEYRVMAKRLLFTDKSSLYISRLLEGLLNLVQAPVIVSLLCWSAWVEVKHFKVAVALPVWAESFAENGLAIALVLYGVSSSLCIAFFCIALYKASCREANKTRANQQ